MPELPEVETTRNGLLPVLLGRRVAAAHVLFPRLRLPIPPQLPILLPGRCLTEITRRGKYLLLHFPPGWLLIHLGMSGSLRVQATDSPRSAHTHFEIIFAPSQEQAACALRLRDPRRFGLVAWCAQTPQSHPLLIKLGQEPLAAEFDGAWLYAATRNRSAAIKTVLMDAHCLVGVGNIYAAESLFLAGIAPQKSACTLNRKQCAALATAVRTTLNKALQAGGSSLRDFVHSDGASGYFQTEAAVYGRADAPCPRCQTAIKRTLLAGRATYHCPHCQR